MQVKLVVNGFTVETDSFMVRVIQGPSKLLYRRAAVKK